MKKRFMGAIALAAAALAAIGCTPSVYSRLTMPNSDPTQAILRSVSSKKAYTVDLAWDADPAASGYRVYRSNTLTGPRETVYYGEAAGFSDSVVPGGTIAEGVPYFYFLEKVRGGQTFPLSEPELAFKSPTILDTNEPNDGVDAATCFNRVADGNLFVFRKDGYLKIDHDWYAATLAPHETWSIILTAVSAETPPIYLMREGEEPRILPLNSAFTLVNATDAPATRRFRLNLGQESLTGDGGMFFAYRLNLKTISIDD